MIDSLLSSEIIRTKRSLISNVLVEAVYYIIMIDYIHLYFLFSAIYIDEYSVPGSKSTAVFSTFWEYDGIHVCVCVCVCLCVWVCVCVRVSVRARVSTSNSEYITSTHVMITIYVILMRFFCVMLILFG